MGKGDSVSGSHPHEASEPNPASAEQRVTVEGTLPYQSGARQQMYQVGQNSLVLSGTGNPVSVPQDKRVPYPPISNGFSCPPAQTSYSDQMLPISMASANDTLVISDSAVYSNAFSRSNMAVSYNYPVDLPNYEATSNSVSAASEPNSASISYYDPPMVYTPQASGPVFNQCPTGAGSSGGAGPVQSTSAAGQSSCVTGYSSQSYGNSLVTGLGGASGGGGGGGGQEPWRQPTNLPRSHYNDPNVFVEEDADELLRRIIDPPDMNQPDTLMGDLGLFTEIDHLQPGFDCLPEAMASTPEDPSRGYYISSEMPSVQPMEESGRQSRGEIGEGIAMIKMMKKPYKPVNLSLGQPNLTVPEQAEEAHYTIADSPASTTMQSPKAPIQVSNPTPTTPMEKFPQPVQVEEAPSSVPPTPAEQRPFDTNTYIQEGKRFLELKARQGLPQKQMKITLEALFFSYRMAMQLEECCKQRNDLKVANDLCASLCSYEFNPTEKKLVFTMPAGCVPLPQWLQEKGNSIDLRERQFIQQQILNTLAKIHTIGSQDKLNLWGSFMAFVAPDMRVYLLIDFIVMLGKMEQAQYGTRFNFDPRLEDIKAVYELHQLIMRPFVDRDANWVSPGVKQLMNDFDRLLTDPTSVYRMAEIARMFGDRRMCKLEVDIMSLDITIFCIEHERLHKALQPLHNLVPTDNDWIIQWVNSGQVVTESDMASADRRMQIRVVQSPYLSHNRGVTLQPTNYYRGY